MDEFEYKLQFIQGQYNQYWEMMRFHLNLSWNIPTLAIVTVVAFIAIDPEKVGYFTDNPALPAITLLIAGLFMFLMFLHNYRNLMYADIFAKAITELESEFGISKKVHHSQLNSTFKGLSRISSSKSLSAFLLILAILLLIGSSYLWYLVLF